MGRHIRRRKRHKIAAAAVTRKQVRNSVQLHAEYFARLSGDGGIRGIERRAIRSPYLDPDDTK